MTVPLVSNLFRIGTRSYDRLVKVDSGTAGTTGTRARTRRAILDAAVQVLSQDSAASLADVAAAADVGRTTLHRYFPERSDLLAAISTDTLERIATATTRARLDEGSAAEALDRLCQEYFELGDVLMLAFTEPHLLSGPGWEDESDSDRALYRAIERGHADGTVDPELSTAWVGAALWSLLFAAWQHNRDEGVSRHEALALCLRSLQKLIAI